MNITDDMTDAEKKHVSLTNDYLNKLEQLSIDLNKAAAQLPVIFSPKIGNIQVIFSSSEHEVLRVSYCDWSVVRLSVRSQLQKKSSSPKQTIRFQ